MSAWTIIVKFLPKNLWYWWILLTFIKMFSILRRSSYFFFWAFSAAFVTYKVALVRQNRHLACSSYYPISYLARRNFFEINRFYNANSNRLTHVTDSKTSQWWKFLKTLHTQRFRWYQYYNSRITLKYNRSRYWRYENILMLMLTGFYSFRILFRSFTRTTVTFLFDFGKFACNVSSMTIKNWGITVGDLTRVIQNNYLKLRKNLKKKSPVKNQFIWALPELWSQQHLVVARSSNHQRHNLDVIP